MWLGGRVGLRRQIKALVSSEARVQIPPQPNRIVNMIAHLAQKVERWPFKPMVVGSIPTVGIFSPFQKFSFFVVYCAATTINNIHTLRELCCFDHKQIAVLAEWSKALRSGRSIFGCVGSNPTGCNDIVNVKVFFFR